MTSRELHAAWDIARIPDLNGSVDRRLPWGSWQVPNTIELEGDRLVWAFQWPSRDGKSDQAWSEECSAAARDWNRRPKPGMLDVFVRLPAESPERILDFARRWGLLSICEHGLPSSHNPPQEPQGIMPDGRVAISGCRPLRYGGNGPFDELWHWEPLSAWRAFAGQARSILNMIASVRTGKAGRPADVHTAHAGYAATGWEPPSVEATRIVIADCLDGLLRMSRVRPAVRWLDGEAGTITLGGDNLFQALSVQLALHATQSDGMALCSACNTAYTPRDRNGQPRRPNPRRRSYCPACRDRGAPQRDASAAYRQRQRARRHDADPYPSFTPKLPQSRWTTVDSSG